MSVIIRLQNLPWSANAVDIRQFFKGLSIPEGGVHIVGGELGDAFIAFSTDEDARQAMMHDRECIKEVQIRLLLSSRAEMQKVIETARLQSISLLQQMALRTALPINSPAAATTAATTSNGAIKMPIQPSTQQTTITKPSASAALPQTSDMPIGANNLFGTPASFLAYQQQAGITLTGSPIATHDEVKKTKSESSNRSSYERDHRQRSSSRDRHRSRTNAKSRSRSRDRDSNRDRDRDRDRDRGRDRDRDSKNRRHDDRRTSHRSRSRDHSSDRSRNRSDYNHSSRRTESKERDVNNRSGYKDLTNISSSSLWIASPNDKDKQQQQMQQQMQLQLHLQQQQQAKGTTTTSNSPWGITTAMNAYSTNAYQTTTPTNSYSTTTVATGANAITNPLSQPEIIIPAFQNYTSNISNNYSVNLFGNNSSGSVASIGNDAAKPFVLQNPYTTALHSNSSSDSNSNSQPPALIGENKPTATTTTTIPVAGITAAAAIPLTTSTITTMQPNDFQTINQEAIAFAKTNPYEQMYPSLFAQAAAQTMPRCNALTTQRTNSPVYRHIESIPYPDSSSVKISNMCSSTNYSDLRKFFSGLFIPHNGIKMVNDRNGMRSGVAFIQFSRQTSVMKALSRNQSLLKSKPIRIEVVPDEEFMKAEDSYRPSNRFDRQNYHDNNSNDNMNDRDQRDRRYNDSSYGGGGGGGGYNHQNDNNDGMMNDDENNSYNKQNDDIEENFNVLYIEDLPPLTTEQDIMKMFSSYTIYDILLMPSVENRREFVAFVKFSLPADARAACDNKSNHMIGYRKVRVKPGKEKSMESAKEKLRLANEQLMKEEEEQNQANDVVNLVDDDDDDNDNDNENDDDDEDVASQANSIQSSNSRKRDPRIIPSLFDMPGSMQQKTDGNNADNNMNASPADPRLRTRQRPSRFDNDTNSGNNNDNIGNNNGNNNSNIANNNGGNNGMTNDNVPPFDNMNMNSNNVGGNYNDMMMMTRYPRMNNPMEDTFVLLYNCPYNIRCSDVGELFMSANLQVKHVEILNNDRGKPLGDVIVEVSNPREAEVAVKDFHNIKFHGRNLRVRYITPQEIADRLRKPFLNYQPGGGPNNNNGSGGYGGYNNNNNNGRMGNGMYRNSGGGGGGGGGGGPGMRSNNHDNDNGYGSGDNSPNKRRRYNNKRPTNRRNNYDDSNDNDDFNDDNDDMPPNRHRDKNGPNNNNMGGGGGAGGIPEKFTRSDCVLAMENVPYKADSEDIIRFFGKFKLRPDDIIRRFNDEGAPTGDARVAFQNAGDAREAYETLNRKQIFNRTIYLNKL